MTAPEIEMLIIHAEKKYDDFKRKNLKPSEYCKTQLKYGSVKNYQFIKEYFSNVDILISAISDYHNKSYIQKDEITLYDLLKR